MAQKNGLHQEIKQKLNITMTQLAPELEKSDIAMAETVKNELETNGALEIKEATDTHETETDRREKEREKELDRQEKENMAKEFVDPEDAKYGKAEDEYKKYFSSNRSSEDIYTPVAVSEESLDDHLLAQLNQEEGLTNTQRKIAEYIIGNLDSNGWLARMPEDIADDLAIKEGVDVYVDQVKEVLGFVQALDPVGVGCTSLRECILLQLETKKANKPANVLAYNIIDKYFTDFTKKHFDKICSKLDITQEQLEEAYKVIRKTNPRPGAGYSSGSSDIHREQISPDFEIEVQDDEIICTLPNRIPELQLSTTYGAIVDMGEKDKKFKERQEYKVIKDQYDRGRKFIDLLKMRQMKLQAVMGSIIRYQEDYFLSGSPADLRPLAYRDIVEDTGLDSSTISRVCKDKYVMTPWGVKKLRYFFSEGVSDDLSNTAVKHALKQIIDAEDKSKPYSDARLEKLLQEKNIDISRRTVAKYREAMGIADSRGRKEMSKKK